MKNNNISAISRIVLEDLKYLKNHWADVPSDSELRIISPILRRLFCETGDKNEYNFHYAWTEAGFNYEPKIAFYYNYLVLNPYPGDIWNAQIYKAFWEAYIRNPDKPIGTFGDLIRLVNNNIFIYAHSDEVTVGRVTFQGIRIEMPDKELKITEAAETVIRNLTFPQIPKKFVTSLSSYLNSHCLFIFGRYIRRKELIRCITDIYGGIHIDIKKNIEPRARKCILLDIFSKFHGYEFIDECVELTPPYFALLAIWKSIIMSPDINLLISKLTEISNTGK